MDLKTINQRIGNIRRTGANRLAYIQETAVGIMQHALDHGDCTAALRLAKAMTPFERAGIVNWFVAFSPIGINLKDDKARFIKPESNRYNAFNVEGAKANPWHTFELEKVTVQVPNTLLEFDKAAERFIKRWQDNLKNGTVKKTSVEAVKGRIEAFSKLIGFEADADDDLKAKRDRKALATPKKNTAVSVDSGPKVAAAA